MMRTADYLEGYSDGYIDGWDDFERMAVLMLANWNRERQPITTNQQLGDYVESLIG